MHIIFFIVEVKNRKELYGLSSNLIGVFSTNSLYTCTYYYHIIKKLDIVEADLNNSEKYYSKCISLTNVSNTFRLKEQKLCDK